MSREHTVTDNMEEFLSVLPDHVREALRGHPDLDDLLEVVIDLGRPIEARFPDKYEILAPVASRADIAFVVERVGQFDRDNRAGIERTLHRISCIRNRLGEVVGLTCRVGRAVYGTIDIIRDVVETGRNLLLLGRPGVGKTTKLREAARVLADELNKRVVVVDTNNEIAGDGDIPHPGIGRARRMQVPNDRQQSDVMIEAVENHMPEVIVIDEIGGERDAFACRTIAERGVQLIATAHGNTLENLMSNPALCDLIGGIQAVTLSDEEARKRGTQKTVLERKALPTFDTIIEIEEMNRLVIHHDVAASVDKLLAGKGAVVEVRELDENGEVQVTQRVVELVGSGLPRMTKEWEEDEVRSPAEDMMNVQHLYPVGVSKRKVEKAIRELRLPLTVVDDPRRADLVLATSEGRAVRRLGGYRPARMLQVRSNTYGQIYEALREAFNGPATSQEQYAIREAEEAVARAIQEGRPVDLMPQNAYIRRLQHEVISRHGLRSISVGREPRRHVRVLPSWRDE